MEDLAIPQKAQIDLLVIQDPLDMTLAAQLSRTVLSRLSDRAVVLICDAEAAEADALHAVLGSQVEHTTLFAQAPDLPACILALWGKDQPERLRMLVHRQAAMPDRLVADTVFTALGSGLIAAQARDDLQNRVAQARKDLAASQQLLEQIQAEHHERIEDIVALTVHFRAQIDDASEQARARAAETSALKQQVKDLAHQLDEVGRHRDSLLNSTSWKITKPIRAVMRTLRGY